MNVIEAIRTRRTIAKFRPEPVPRDVLARVLAAGIWAPNHHLTEPWQFFILGPETRGRMAVRYAELRMEKAPPDAVERRARIRQESARKFMEIPAIVAVATLQEGDEQRRREDFAATCCAIQNVQLAAWAEGLGVKWSTAPVIHDSLTYHLLDLDPDRYSVIALLYVGYPAEVPTRERKRPLDDVIRITA
jgi:nitroreductase